LGWDVVRGSSDRGSGLEHLAFLIDRTLEVVRLAAYPHENLVQVAETLATSELDQARASVTRPNQVRSQGKGCHTSQHRYQHGCEHNQRRATAKEAKRQRSAIDCLEGTKALVKSQSEADIESLTPRFPDRWETRGPGDLLLLRDRPFPC
jgi:hypothetical protein